MRRAGPHPRHARPGRLVKLARPKRTVKIFMGNAGALMDPPQEHRRPIYMAFHREQPAAFEEFLDETKRRHLHNYVAAHTHVDHFRRFKDAEWPEGSAAGAEYQRRVDQDFKDSPLHNFIVKLRNLILHVRLPVSTTTESWQRGGTLIEDCGHSIDLGDTVSAYTSEIIAFDRWTAELFIKGQLQEIESFLDAARKAPDAAPWPRDSKQSRDAVTSRSAQRRRQPEAASAAMV